MSRDAVECLVVISRGEVMWTKLRRIQFRLAESCLFILSRAVLVFHLLY